MINAAEIKARLNSQAERVCRDLLAHGKRRGRQWVCGDIHGGSGDSTIVELDGPKAGVWSDFATSDEKGDLFALWMAVKKMSFRQAFKEIKSYLGITDPVSDKITRPIYAKANTAGIIKLENKPEHEVVKYLTEKRLLLSETIRAFKVGAKADHDGVGGTDIAFPIYDPVKNLLNIKYLGLERTWHPEKKVWEKHSYQEKNCPPGLFGWQAFELEMTTAIITEGEIDAMTYWNWGYKNVLSIPAGANNEKWIDWDWENLEPFETIYLSFDKDKPGQDAALSIAKRLGIHRCRIVQLPHKDANECLQKGCTIEDAVKWLHESKYIVIPEIKTPDDYREAIHKFFDPSENDESIGLKTRIFGNRLRFRPSEMTLWSGHTSHGKSTLLNQIMLDGMMANQRVAIGSFEVRGVATLAKMICCALFDYKPIFEDREKIIDWLRGKIWLFDFVGLIKRPHLLEMMKYSVMRHGVHHFVIDSIMKCDLNSEDYEAQRQFINELHCFSHEHGVHVHLVGHPRKGKDDESPPGIMDVHGGQSVIGQPDNCVIVWRNKKKEKDRERESSPMSDSEANKEPDTVVYIQKQRLTGEEGKIRLWFNRRCNRFTTHDGKGEPTFENFGILPKQTTERKDYE